VVREYLAESRAAYLLENPNIFSHRQLTLYRELLKTRDPKMFKAMENYEQIIQNPQIKDSQVAMLIAEGIKSNLRK